MKKSYCTQNDGDCSTCSLVNYGRDCQNNPIESDEATERREARIAAMKAVTQAPDFESEQAALKKAFYVDLRPSLPAGAVDLYHGWNERQEPDTTRDYVEVCKRIGAGFDRGARRYVIRQSDVTKARDALIEAGFMPCISPSLLIGK